MPADTHPVGTGLHVPVIPPDAILTALRELRDSLVIAVDERTAAELTGLSGKSLKRLADAGEPIGRVRVGTRVIYLTERLKGYLAAQADTQRVATPT